MTAEVAIINSGAIALAADSAVTIGGQKIYNSAIKLFALSKTEPVAIMIYGNANLLDVPWETLIKSFRVLNGSKKLDNLEEYSQGFLNYLAGKAEYFSEETQKSWFFGNVHAYFSIIRDEAFQKTQENTGTTKDEFIDIINRSIIEHHSEIINRALIDEMDDDYQNFIRKKYHIDIDDIIIQVFEKVPFQGDIEEKLIDIAVCLLTRDIFSDGKSGVVVAGFGDKEIYPSVITHEIEAFFEGKLKYKCVKNKSQKIQNGSHCTIIAFAQEDMVHTFMRGINPAVSDMLINYMRQLFE